MGKNGSLEGLLFASCTANANGKRIRAFISSANTGATAGVGGTRFVNLNIGAQSSTAIVGMRGFGLFNKNSESSQISHPSASAGVSAATSTFDFENLGIDTTQTFYITIGLQKDITTDALQLQMARVQVNYAP